MAGEETPVGLATTVVDLVRDLKTVHRAHSLAPQLLEEERRRNGEVSLNNSFIIGL